MLTYVTLRPNSITNPGDDYRVVPYAAWLAASEGPIASALDGETFADGAQAYARTDELNAPARKAQVQAG